MDAVVASVMVDGNDIEALAAFWSKLLGIGERTRVPGYIWLDAMPEDGPSLAFQQVPEPKQVKNRVHLDISADDPEAFIARVEELGGSRLADHELEGFHWTVLADPEGNEFCVAKSE
jgi:predicted enzyme related to lactoylglutathione lyase